MNTEKLHKRIRDLLDMAEHETSNPNEAATAARRAAALMRKHNIEHADLILETLSENDFGRRSTEMMARVPQWMKGLALAVAKFTGVIIHIHRHQIAGRGSRATIVFKGHKDEIELANYLFMYLRASVDRMTDKSTATGLTEKNAYRMGFVVQVKVRLESMKEDQARRDRGDEGGMALQVVDAKQAMAKSIFGHEATIKGREARQKPMTAAEVRAFLAGNADGKDLPINPGLNTPEAQKEIEA